MMIKSMNVPNFGSFKSFVWDKSVRDSSNNSAKFKKLNIIYGRNYSGKTTLSRIFRSLQTGELPDKYKNPEFSVSTDSGIITQAEIPAADQQIRVYNRDFVDDHLGFLRDDEDEITPFAIIGSENKAIEKLIAEKEKELGNVEEKTGLRQEYATKNNEFRAAASARDTKKKDIENKLKNKATKSPTGIKHNSIYKDPNYNITKIKADIQTIRSRSLEVLDEKKRKEKEAVLGEVLLPDIKKKIAFTATISHLYEKANELLSKKIAPTEPIKELLDDAILQMWVKEGIPYHRNKRESCGFCGQTLPANLWQKLDEHFSKESSDLETALQQHIESIKKESELVDSIITIEVKDFYSTFHSSFDEAKKALEKEIARYKKMLESIIKSLEGRMADIFSPKPSLDLTDNCSEMTAKIAVINEIIDRNNKKTGSLEDDQKKAREELRLSEIAQFIKDIGLTGEEDKLAVLENKAKNLESETSKLQIKIQGIVKEVEALQIQIKDEKKGAEKVNNYLNHYFGHNGLRLEAVKDGETASFKFQILRGDDPAYNLSEGECSLISFCYFVAKLEDLDSKGKHLIIFIDDPISSLDSNHIFFVFSLIENLIAKSEKNAEDKDIYRYEQLFIATHNLEFFKYLKRLSRQNKKEREYFLLVGKKDFSTLEMMPAYLKNYVTEFNHLFSEIYTCSNPENATKEHHCFYNFGNNLRKFLEVFLFFKYPCVIKDTSRTNAERIKEFFKDDSTTEILVQRLTNEFSHLGKIFDRSVQPIDHDEISKLAKFVLKKIKDNDHTQFKYLLKSIDKPDPF